MYYKDDEWTGEGLGRWILWLQVVSLASRIPGIAMAPSIPIYPLDFLWLQVAFPASKSPGIPMAPGIPIDPQVFLWLQVICPASNLPGIPMTPDILVYPKASYGAQGSIPDLPFPSPFAWLFPWLFPWLHGVTGPSGSPVHLGSPLLGHGAPVSAQFYRQFSSFKSCLGSTPV